MRSSLARGVIAGAATVSSVMALSSVARADRLYVLTGSKGSGSQSLLPYARELENREYFKPHGVAVARDGTIFIADFGFPEIDAIAKGHVTRVVGDGVPRSVIDLYRGPRGDVVAPTAIAAAPDGTIFIADGEGDQVISSKDGKITTVAGTGRPGNVTDPDRNAAKSQLNHPEGVAVGPDGTAFIADTRNHRVLRVGNGKLEVIAGTGQYGTTIPDDGKATETRLTNPTTVAVMSNGNLLIADSGNDRILKLADGKITVFAEKEEGETAPTPGVVRTKLISHPVALAVEADGSVFVGDASTNRVIAIKDGKVTLIAGNGSDFTYGVPWTPETDYEATERRVEWPSGLAVAPDGSLLVSELNQRLFLVAPSDGYQAHLVDLRAQGLAAKKRRDKAKLASVIAELTTASAPDGSDPSDGAGEFRRLRAELVLASLREALEGSKHV